MITPTLRRDGHRSGWQNSAIGVTFFWRLSCRSPKCKKGGRVVIPADLREKYGLAVGDTVVWAEDKHGLNPSSHRASIRHAQAIVAKYKRPGVDEVEEFLRDKRAEAQRE